ncbi:distal membrane-arm assembly complex protein 2 [Pygocentrus nattereri]|uniref:Distal membrane-arm assembly complex protein 2 n=1 Tax=Pygocentrus nattereri TaxID=42514 RepID=A0AAR2KLJ7_PYGNA|nr:distal membrane-arm assembly complex protein 2 [Pygocentrus nattereri]
MAAPVLCQMRRRCPVVAYLSVVRREYASSPPSPPSLFSRFLFQLNQHFHDVEHLINWSSWLRNRVVRRKNVFYGYTQKRFGVNVAAAYYILGLGGGFRFAGHSDWFRPDSRGKFSYDFLNTPNSTIEEIDLSRTLINHAGLENIVSQNELRSLSLQGCPEVDDWFLARLHVFGESLQWLDLSHCPHITVGGLAALQHLRKLRRLDVSSLPRLQNPGLVRILLEEMLPHCEVIGADYEQGLILTDNVEEAEPVRHK